MDKMADQFDGQKSDVEVELRSQLSSLREEFEKLQDYLADVELRYQTALASDGKEDRLFLNFISSLFNQPQYSDVKVLLKGGTTLFGHKLILASQSEQWGDVDFLLVDTLDLSDLDYEVGYTIIKWVYTSQLDKEKEDGYLVDLFKIAIRFQLQPLATRVQQLLIERVDTTNSETYHQLAVTLSADLLKSYCESLVFKCPIPELPVLNNDHDDDDDDDGEEEENQDDDSAEEDDDDDDNEEEDDDDEDFTDIKDADPIKEEMEEDFEPKIRSRSTRQKAQTSKRKLEKQSSNQKGTQPKKAKKKAKFNASRYIGDSLSCFFCCVEYPDLESLTEHLEEHNGQNNPYQCNKCDVKDLATRKLLLRHLTKHKSKACRFCEQEFDGADKLKAHYASDHPKNARYKCLVCDKVYNKKTPYVIHLRVHTGEKPYTCEVCGRAFNERGSLKVHSRLHTGIKPFICELCGKAYYSSTLLNKHIRLHDPNMGHPFACPTCGQKFTQKCHMQTHMMIHTGEKPHQCNYCGKTFTDRSSFNRHNKTHTGERPHVCDLCGKSFIQRVQLVKHNLSHEKQRLSFEMKIPNHQTTFI